MNATARKGDTPALSIGRTHAIAAALALFVAGMAMRGLVSGGGGSAGQSNRHLVGGRLPATTAGPTRTEKGVPAGFAPTKAGAIAAAVSYVCTGQVLLAMDPISAEDAVRTMAAASAADVQVADAQVKLRSTRDSLAQGTGPIVYRQAGVAVRVELFEPERARVAVWNVGVLSRAGAAPPQAGWAISTLELVWERGDWKIWNEVVAPGPAPILNNAVGPATSSQLDTAMTGFVDLASAS